MPELADAPGRIRAFRYTRPKTVLEAVERKGALGGRGRFWAGGTDLMLEWRRRQRSPEACIDISRLEELRTISCRAREVELGACVTLDELDRSAGRCRELSFLASIARVMCTVQTRTLATVGGNLINASPAADLAPPLICLGSRARLQGPRGVREAAVSELFEGPKASSIADDELLVAIVVPRWEERHAGWDRIARTHVDIALALAACSLDVDANGIVTAARVALGAVAPTPVLADTSGPLEGQPVSALGARLVDEAGALAAAAAAPIDDVRTTAAYRREMCAVLTRRALRSAAESAVAGAEGEQ